MKGSGSRPRSSPSVRRNFVVELDADRRLQVGLAQNLAQTAAELAVHADVDVGVHKVAHLGQVRAKRHHHVDLGADAFDQAPDLVQVGRHIEGAVHRPEDVHAGGIALFAFLLGRHPALGHAELGEDPGHRPVGAFPLILVDGARQEALDIGTLRRDATADHLGDGSGHHHCGKGGIECAPGPLHRAFGAVAAQLFLAETRCDDGQLVRGKCICVVQHGCDRQVLAAHRAVDHHLKALDRGKGVNRPPVAPCPVMILHQHQIISAALAARACLSSFF